ncbi:MAG TPA: outer membrane lipoprotein carrier protein LolA [Chitinispirillaceae bacterium]|nr:outer membrane lipoprotein carrier protein LolA [Chitinispirillaceae bacterium]
MKSILFLILFFQIIYADSNGELFQKKISKISNDSALIELYDKFISEAAFSAKFIQTMQVKALNKELVSKGNMVFIPDKGIVWETEKPYNQYLLITKKGEVFEKDNPVPVGEFSYVKIMTEMINSGLDKLSGIFDLFYSDDDVKWLLGLIPRKRVMSKFISNIIISGDRNGKINEVTVMGHDVKITELRFEEHKTLKKEELNRVNEILKQK